MKASEVFLESLAIRDNLKKNNDSADNPIDDSLNPIPPYKVSDEIKLIILGQDPTVKIPTSRKNIKITLNMDKKGTLRNYLSKICSGLGIAYENVYATNVIKYFYKEPPAKTPNVLVAHLRTNLDLLVKELKDYKHIPIIALGQPVLQLLTDSENEVKNYWSYNKKTKKTDGVFDYCKAKDNELVRDFFPFPHQPSLRKEFYKNTLDDYIMFVKNKSSIK